jgi:serine/threonine protein phosphatase PrpC
MTYIPVNMFIPSTDLKKENQDAYSLPADDEPNEDMFFGVYDGHGKDGHQCARFASERVSMRIKAYFL